ncbi:MAG: septum formation protein Maf [Candidatus Omnitrophica bacterium]|nr:septum formation protein Maf [Candidatus Omnitrophota bacterium]
MSKSKIKIYLASISQRRKDLLRKAKIPFALISSSYQEKHEPGGRPSQLVMSHALGKARKASVPKIKNKEKAWILGADTLVYFKGRLLGKPSSLSEARRMLGRMSGHIHWVYTGIALRNAKSGEEKVSFTKTKVKFKNWNEKQIEKYLQRVNPLDKAGAYAIQTRPSIVANYEGSLSNVIGLPLELLRKMLRGTGRKAAV